MATKSTQWAKLSGGFWGPRHFGAGMAPRLNKGAKNYLNHDCWCSTVESRSHELQGTLFIEIRWEMAELWSNRSMQNCALALNIALICT